MRRLRVLVTGVGAPGIRGTLYALRHNPDGWQVDVIGVDISGDAVGKHFVNTFYRVPPPESPDYIPEILNIALKEEVDVVLPQTTREMPALSQREEAFRRKNIGVAVSKPNAISLANDKLRLVQKFAELGLPHPEYRVTRTEEELIAAVQELGYPESPVVVKPPTSNGMRGFRVLKEGAWDLRRFLEDKPDGTEIELVDLLRILRRGSDWPVLMVSEFLPGDEYTVDAFRGERAFVAVARKREMIRSGITFLARLEARSDLVENVRRVAESIDLKYAFGFQFKLDARGVPKVLECNPRVQGTMVASAFVGANVIWWAVREAAKVPVAQEEIEKSFLKKKLGKVAFYRYWGGIGIHDGRVLGEI
jgi:carbamoyl-phosphate synthase large subunit